MALQGNAAYQQRVLLLIPDHLCRIQAWEDFKSQVWKTEFEHLSIGEALLISHRPGQGHLSVVLVQHVLPSLFVQGHGTVLHPELVLPLQSRQSRSKPNMAQKRASFNSSFPHRGWGSRFNHACWRRRNELWASGSLVFYCVNNERCLLNAKEPPEAERSPEERFVLGGLVIALRHQSEKWGLAAALVVNPPTVGDEAISVGGGTEMLMLLNASWTWGWGGPPVDEVDEVLNHSQGRVRHLWQQEPVDHPVGVPAGYTTTAVTGRGPPTPEGSSCWPGSTPAWQRDALTIHSPVVELPEAAPGYDHRMGGVDLRVELRVVLHIGTDLKREGNSGVQTSESRPGGIQRFTNIPSSIYLNQKLNFPHLSGQRFPGSMHHFSPGAELFISYSCEELWPDSSNKSCQIKMARGPSCPPTGCLTFHANPVESTTPTLSPAC